MPRGVQIKKYACTKMWAQVSQRGKNSLWALLYHVLYILKKKMGDFNFFSPTHQYLCFQKTFSYKPPHINAKTGVEKKGSLVLGQGTCSSETPFCPSFHG
jgi:hypothetical protein